MDFEKFTPTMIEVAKQGGNVAEIVDAIERIEKYQTPFIFIVLFVKAFNLTIEQANDIGQWKHFEGSSLSDKEIDQIIMPLIRKNLGMEDWNTP